MAFVTRCIQLQFESTGIEGSGEALLRPKRALYVFTGTVKEVRIGPTHQAEIPEMSQKGRKRDRSILQKEEDVFDKC